MTRNAIATLSALIAVVALLPASPGAQDIRRIDDRSLTRERHERAVQAVLEIDGQKIEFVFHKETVPGAVFLTVTSASRSTSTYRYLGQENSVVRFRLTRGESVGAD